MKAILLSLSVFLTSFVVKAAECSLDSKSFFWDIEIANTPNMTIEEDQANSELDADVRSALQKKGYQVSRDQRKATGHQIQGERDYYSAGRFLFVNAAIEGSGTVTFLLDLSVYSSSPQGLGDTVLKLRSLISKLDQRLLDEGDFSSTQNLKVPGLLFVSGAKERFFGIGQGRANLNQLANLPVCKAN